MNLFRNKLYINCKKIILLFTVIQTSPDKDLDMQSFSIIEKSQFLAVYYRFLNVINIVIDHQLTVVERVEKLDDTAYHNTTQYNIAPKISQ